MLGNGQKVFSENGSISVRTKRASKFVKEGADCMALKAKIEERRKSPLEEKPCSQKRPFICYGKVADFWKV